MAIVKNQSGGQGEQLAANYLCDNQFDIRHRNWRYQHKEIDIIAVKNNTLHIIEVKTRTKGSWQQASEAIVRRKQQNLLLAAEAYIQQHNIDYDTQFDVIAITLHANNTVEIEYIPNAFTASEL